jgi:N-acetylneuraminic acid mutarotase
MRLNKMSRLHKHSIALFTIFVITFSFFSFQFSIVSASTPDSWTTKLSIPTARTDAGVAVVNGLIYVIGGYKSGSLYVATNEVYNPVTDSWSTKNPMPTPRSGCGVAVFQNKIFVIGGRIGSTTDGFSSANEVYDPTTDTWTTKTSMPTERGYLSANEINGKIYAMGGMSWLTSPNGWKYHDTNEVYNPVSDSWTTAAPMPNQAYGFASAVVDHKIYAISGLRAISYTNSLIPKTCQIYDPASNSWSLGKDIPTGVVFPSAAVTSGSIYPKAIYVIAGGYYASNPGPDNYVQVYDPIGNTWVSGTPIPTARVGLVATAVNDIIYAIGGQDRTTASYLTKNEQYTPLSSIAPTPTPTVAPTPTPTVAPTPTPTVAPTPTPTVAPTPTPTVAPTPTPTVAPTPTPTVPEFPPFIIVCLIATFSACVLILKKKLGKFGLRPYS